MLDNTRFYQDASLVREAADDLNKFWIVSAGLETLLDGVHKPVG
jgi:hypothetical protein